MTFHSYIFLKSYETIKNVSKKNLEKIKLEFLKAFTAEKNVHIETYATLGLKKDSNILFWIQAENVESVQDCIRNILDTGLGAYLNISYTLFGMVRKSQYSQNEQFSKRKGGKYLIIYPFTKTPEWHMLSFEKRKKLMTGHIAIGRKYPQISQLLLYSYGVDDQEFIVSYETDNLLDFQTLVIELRSDKVREYTQNDTPIFTCIYKTPKKVLEYL